MAEKAVRNAKVLAQKPTEPKLLGPKFELHPVGLTVIGKPTEEEYEEAFRRLSYIDSAIAWWWGDLANARERHYGSLKELAEKLEIDYESLRKYQYIAGRYEMWNRFHNLSFKHHMIAAPLEDRYEWLQKAKGNKWSTRQLQAEIRKATTPSLPSGKFSVIYADPPWEYEFSQSESRSIEAHYPTMSLEEICNLQVPVAEDAVLFLWATSPKLREALQVMEAWGFEYRTNMVWVKAQVTQECLEPKDCPGLLPIHGQIGMGYYCREQHELLLIGRRGDISMPDPQDRPPSVIIAPRSEHSRKPEVVYELIEQMYPGQPKIELFARQRRPGWIAWGDEVSP